jgi:hypothetical protein
MTAMRSVALWAVLFAAYAATIGVDAAGEAEFAGAEPHFLIAAESLADGGDLDLADEYAGWRGEPVEGETGAGARGERPIEGDAGVVGRGERPARTDGRVVGGRLVEPHGIGFPLLITPARALGGERLVVVLLAAVAALAFVLAAELARRVVPDPWATWAALLAGLSAPAVAHATAVLPALAAGALLAGAALCALAVRERPLMRHAYGGAALLAVLPWLDPWLLVPAAPVAALLARWTSRRGRRLVAFGTLEVQFASLVFYVSLNERLYGGLTPLSAGQGPITGATSPGDYLERIPRLAELWVDRDVGVLRWAPVLALAFLGVWLLVRSRRDRLARLLAEQRDAEHAAFLALAVCAGQVAVAAFASPQLEGPWFPGTQLVAALPCAVALLAWGLRHAPRVGVALGALSLTASGWLALTADWAPPESDAPWGPLVAAFPVGAALALMAWLGVEWWRRRRELRL